MLKMTIHKFAALLLSTLGLLMLHTTTAQGSTSAVGEDVSAKAAGCVGTSWSGTLGNQKAICNGNYLVRMQGNGDLVLRVISSGRACWHSNTAGAWSNDAYAVFNKNIWGKPYVDVVKDSQGRLKRLVGWHTPTTFGTNASVNYKGEFWIGYRKVAYC